MATRMQQRRGTAQQWTNANPILASAEIGYESDTNKFKIGDGVNHWADLDYFTTDSAASVTAQVQAAIDGLIGGAPGTLDTLNELAASLGDNADFIGSMTTSLAAKAPLASPTFTGIVSGITKSMVGLENVNNTSDADKPVSTATQTALDLKANSSAITELAQDAVNSAIVAGTGLDKTYDDAGNTITLDIDSTVATKTYADGAVSDAVAALTKSSVGLANVDDTSDLNKQISTATQTALDSKLASSTAASTYETISNVALKAPIASPTFTGTVSGITKSMVGLGNVDNTTDVNKPISSATQTALDLKLNAADIIDGGGV